MKALFAFFHFTAPAAAHDDTLRANQFNNVAGRETPWTLMLPLIHG